MKKMAVKPQFKPQLKPKPKSNGITPVASKPKIP